MLTAVLMPVVVPRKFPLLVMQHLVEFIQALENWLASGNAGGGLYDNAFAGIYLAPSSFEAGFTSMAHSEEDIDRTIAAAREVMREI